MISLREKAVEGDVNSSIVFRLKCILLNKDGLNMKNEETEIKHRKKRKVKNNVKSKTLKNKKERHKDKLLHKKKELPLAERRRRRKRARKRVVFLERLSVACFIAAFLGGAG